MHSASYSEFYSSVKNDKIIKNQKITKWFSLKREKEKSRFRKERNDL